MSEMMLIIVYRDNSVVAQSTPNNAIAVEKHFNSESEQHGPYGIRPFYQYLCIVQGQYDIKQNDYLKDQQNNDSVTNAPYAYQVTTRPEPFPDGHMEFHANDARITGF